MNQQERFEAHYADLHGVPVESMASYRMEDSYRLPAISLHYLTFKAAENGLAASKSAIDVIAERARQIAVENRMPGDDDDYTLGQLAAAASGYALGSTKAYQSSGCPRPPYWPWSPRWWKPGDPRKMLVKAGALILAEIERIDRMEEGNARNAEG